MLFSAVLGPDGRSARRWITPALLIAVGLGCLAVAYERSGTRTLAHCGMNDTVRYFEPMGTYVREMVLQGQLPLWNPYQGCGTPLFAMMQTDPFYPGNWPGMLWSAPGFKFGAALHAALAVTGMLLWLRALEIQLPAALAGAIIFVTNGAMLHLVCTQSFQYAIAWWPLLFWGVDRVLSNPHPRAAAVLSLIGAAMLLTGGMQFVVYGGYGVLAYTLFRLATQIANRNGRPGRAVLHLAVASACAVALAAVQLLPTMEASSLSQRSAEGITASQITYYAPLGLAGAARELVSADRSGYLGTCLILIVASALGTGARGTRLAFAMIAVLFWLLTAGTGQLFEAFIHLPTGNWFRFPTRLFILIVFACATLSAFAVQDIIDGAKIRAPRLLLLISIAALTCYALDPARRWYAIALASIFIGTNLTGAMARPVRTAIAYLIPFALLVEVFGTAPDPLKPFDSITAYSRLHGELIAYLRQHQGMGRVHFRHGMDVGVPLKSGMRHRIYADLDYDAFMPRRITEYWEYLAVGNPTGKDVENGILHLTIDASNLHLLDYLSTRYIVESPWEPFLTRRGPPFTEQFKRVFTTRDGYSVVENLGARPRLAVVARAELSPPGEPLLKRLADPRFPADGTVLVEHPEDVIDAPSTSAGSATFSRYLPEDVEIVVDARMPGMLMLNDVLYPGWRATVDGRPVPITLVNYLFRGVKIPEGTHRVRFEYRPFSVYLGTGISMVGVISLALLFAIGGRRT